jgi:hypothetical protein
MAIVQSMVSSFKQQILLGEHDLDTDVIKIALYTSAASLDASTTAYSTSNEVVGVGYTAGGNTLTGATVSLSGTTAYVDFADTTWAASTITARAALIYNSSKSNKAIAVLDFGSDKTTTANNFTVQFPTNDASSAIVRIA